MKMRFEIETIWDGKFGKREVELNDVPADVYALIKLAVDIDKDGKGIGDRMDMRQAFLSGWHIEDLAKQAKVAAGLNEDDCCFWKLIDPK